MIRRISVYLGLATAATLCLHCHAVAARGSAPTSDANNAASNAAAQTRDTQAEAAREAGVVEASKTDTANSSIIAERKAESEVEFDDNAFPPTLPDTEWHQNAWLEPDCLRCHETGVGDAPTIVHEGLPRILLSAKCRTCHVLIPGSVPKEKPEVVEVLPFDDDAFPPMIPNSESHNRAWTKDDCLLCHESGIRYAPIVQHEGLPKILLTAKCRSCHVQVRAVEKPAPAE